MDGDQFAGIAYFAGLMLLIGPAILVQFTKDTPKALRNVGIWVLIFAAIAVGYMIFNPSENESAQEDFVNEGTI